MFPKGEDIQPIVRVGIISSVDSKRCTAKVYFEDLDDTVTHDLRIVVPQTMKTKVYYMPDVGEQVLCLFLQNGIETGFIIGSVYSEVDNPPVTNDKIKGFWLKGGTSIQFDESTNTLIVSSPQPVTINANVIINGNMNVNGSITSNS